VFGSVLEETLMSKGPGRVQRAVLALIDAEPHGAWMIGEVCERAYPLVPANANALAARIEDKVAEKHRAAVQRVLRRTKLPGTWEVTRNWQRGRENVLFDPCDDESAIRAHWLRRARWMPFARWMDGYPREVEEARRDAQRARRWRDTSPIERLNVEIAGLQAQLVDLKIKKPVRLIAAQKKIAALTAERDQLKAAAAAEKNAGPSLLGYPIRSRIRRSQRAR
jgi:hypothetical protein